MPLQTTFKRYTYSFCILFASLMISNCASPKKAQISGVHFIKNDNQTITLASVGYGRNKKNALNNAEINAFDVLLFKGIPNSPFTKPLIPAKESEVKSKNESFFKNFYTLLGYKEFVIKYSTLSPPNKDKRTKKMTATVQITINVSSLRRNLEQNNITPKFGL